MRNMETNRSIVALSPEARKRVERAMAIRGESGEDYFSNKNTDVVEDDVVARVGAMSGKERRDAYKGLYFKHAVSGAGFNHGDTPKEFNMARVNAGLDAADQNIAITLGLYMSPEAREASRRQVYTETMDKFDRAGDLLDERVRNARAESVRDGQKFRGWQDQSAARDKAAALEEAGRPARLARVVAERLAREDGNSMERAEVAAQENAAFEADRAGSRRAKVQALDRGLARDNSKRLRSINAIPPGPPEGWLDAIYSPHARGQLKMLMRDKLMSSRGMSPYARFKLMFAGGMLPAEE